MLKSIYVIIFMIKKIIKVPKGVLREKIVLILPSIRSGHNVGAMFKASELLMCIVYIYNIIENKGILKKIGETPMNAHDIVLYAPVCN